MNILIHSPMSSSFELFDTVVLKFDESKLKEEKGTWTWEGESEHLIIYDYVLERPDLVRPTGPGEPTFA